MIEWGLFLAVLAVAIVPFRNRGMKRALAAVAAVLWVAVIAAVIWGARETHHEARQAEIARTLPREGRPGGYVTSDTCRSCHPGEYATWHRSFHRTMTQYATPESVRADFDNVTFRLEGETYFLERRGNEFWVQMNDPDWKLMSPAHRGNSRPERVWRRVGLVTGSHHMQAFWVPSKYSNLQLNLPFTYLFDEHRWVPRNAAFLMDPKIPALVQIWNANCLQCHATAGQPRPEPDNPFLVDTRVGELGIACEACHGPAEAHVRANRNPIRRYVEHHAAKQKDDLIVNPARLDHRASAQVCGQCHGIKWIPNGHPWRFDGFAYRPGQDLQAELPIVRPMAQADQPWFKSAIQRDPRYVTDRYWSDGEVRVSGRDFNGLIESPCYQRGTMSCLSCHSMHHSDPNAQLARGMETNQACLQCHKNFNVASHTRHAPASSGSLCYNCHMPHTVYGLMRAIRSHTISNPSVETTLATGRPNACNLCHLDKSLGWTASKLNEWYGTPVPKMNPDQRQLPAAAVWALSGDAGQRALLAWHMGWAPAKKISGTDWLFPYLAQLLNDPYATVRYLAGHSLTAMPEFRDFAFDYIAPENERVRATEEAVMRWKKIERKQNRPEVYLDSATWSRLLRARDDKPMYLQE
jgi:predicted CXXCH cytochrome family protein